MRKIKWLNVSTVHTVQSSSQEHDNEQIKKKKRNTAKHMVEYITQDITTAISPKHMKQVISLNIYWHC